MIEVKVGDTSLSEYITEYSINVSEVKSDNGFTAADGELIEPVIGEKIAVQLTMERVPHKTAQEIKSASDGEFTLTYTNPAAASGSFRRTSYNADPYSADPREKNPLITDKILWNINMSLECTTQNGDGRFL